MGMSASQARLLTLTARLSDLEFSAQSISNSKIRLADQTEDAATAYSNALNQQKLTVYNSDTSAYVDATAYNLTTYNAVSQVDKQRLLVNNYGQIGVSKSVAEAFEKSKDSSNTTTASYAFRNNPDPDTGKTYGSLQDALMGNVDNYPEGDFDQDLVDYYSRLWNGAEDFLYQIDKRYTCDPSPADANKIYDPARATYYTNLFIEMQKNGYYVIEGENMNDSQWLQSQLTNGTMYIKNWDHDGGKQGTGEFVEVPWKSGDPTLRTTDDDSAIAKAQAEYDTEMARINSKETKLDLQLKQIDTEHNAIQTEMDSVKKVIDKNIERTFKIFDA